MPEQLEQAIANVPDFPKPGIIFKDITPILANPALFERAIKLMAAPWRDRGITHVAGIEARGFIFASAVAIELDCGFIPIRKPGKLPRACFSQTYALEYGTDTLEIHRDAVGKNDTVLIVDDLLATGGTAAASLELLSQCDASIAGYAFLIELAFLEGHAKLGDTKIERVISF